MAGLPQRKTSLTARLAQAKLRSYRNSTKALFLQRFFKTGPGEYGYGDRFLGIAVGDIRKTATEFAQLSLAQVSLLLRSKIHEERLLAAIILTLKFAKATNSEKKQVFDFYLGHRMYINNWDIVDCSAHKIVGPYLEEKDKTPLFKLARSRVLWDRRIAIIATLHYIRQDVFETAFAVSSILIQDQEDLIQKAVGWMLREIGKRDFMSEERFLRSNYKTMPRTMLRYAIERFPEAKRKAYLQGRY